MSYSEPSAETMIDWSTAKPDLGSFRSLIVGGGIEGMLLVVIVVLGVVTVLVVNSNSSNSIRSSSSNDISLFIKDCLSLSGLNTLCDNSFPSY